MTLHRKGVGRAVVYIFLILFLIVELFPILWVVATSFKTSIDIFNWPPKIWPDPVTLSNYAYIFNDMNLQNYLLNSIIVAIITTVICIVIGIPCAYAISRFRTGGKGLSSWILMQRMIPSVAIIIPLFILLWKIHLLDTWFGLAIAHVTYSLPFGIWLMIGFFGDIPIELEESGMVDGCPRMGAFRHITLPLVVPGLVAMAVLIAIQSWNEFLYAVILTSSRKSQTLPVVISVLVHPVTDILYGEMCAAAVVAIIPVFIFTLSIQKYLVRGLTAGSVKG